MPNIVQGSMESDSAKGIWTVSYDYDYPNELNLKPGSKTHKKIVDEVMRRGRLSRDAMSSRYPVWNNIDRVMNAFVPLDEAEKLLKGKDSRKPVSIVVPYSYAVMETLLTYLVSALMDDPILQYEGSGPEDVLGAKLMEKVIAQQAVRGKLGLQLHTMFRDCLSYGVGPGVCTWKTQIGKKTIRKDMEANFLSRFLKMGNTRTSTETILYEGNILKNVDPYMYLPDPSVPVHQIQEGEFVGWIERTNIMNLLSQEEVDDETFNVRYLRHIDGRSTLASGDDSKREERIGGRTDLMDGKVKNYVDVLYMYAKIIPKDWGLGSREYPEKWMFGVAGDSVVVEARPLALDHDQYPLSVAAPDFDGYTATPLSRVELIYGMQSTIDWLFSSHISNVRKAINDTLIVDPYMVNMRDLEDPEPGKLVRLRRAAWGKGVKDAVQQLAVNDITRNHIADSSYLADLIQRVSAASDGIMGVRQRGSERITAHEIQSDKQSALSRLERIARVISMQAMHDIGFLFASHTQQLMSTDTYVRVVGEWPELMSSNYGKDMEQGRIPVTPFDILVDYDLVIRDGSMPGGKFADTWTSLFQVIMQNPELGQQFDIVRIFKSIATSLGEKNVNDFVRKGGDVQQTTLPDQTVESEAQAGNLVPISAGGIQ